MYYLLRNDKSPHLDVETSLSIACSVFNSPKLLCETNGLYSPNSSGYTPRDNCVLTFLNYRRNQTQAHLSDVYWGRSKVNNNTPRSMTNPPPWANLDPRVLSPIPDKKKRETHWDDSFFRGNCLQRNEIGTGSKANTTTLRKRPASAGVRRGKQEATSAKNAGHGDGNSSNRGGANKLRRGVKSRPSSANVRGRGEAYAGSGSSTTTRRDEAARFTAFAANGRRGSRAGGMLDYHACSSVGGGGGLLRRNTTDGGGSTNNVDNSGTNSGAYSVEEREILAGGYRLNSRQEATFREFVAMLVDFDTCSTVNILDDVFREAQLATGLQDFTGCGAD